jgi:signal peptidase II
MYAALLLLTAALVAALDQSVKALVVARLSAGFAVPVIGVELRSVINRDSGQRRSALWTAVLVVQAVWLCGIVEWVPMLQQPLAIMGIGAALGGATGNVVDRCRRNGVIDYIDVGFWPVFNLADVAIVLGIGAAILALLL